jgi:hypothetical protein
VEAAGRLRKKISEEELRKYVMGKIMSLPK